MKLNIFFRPLLYLDPGTGSFIIQILLAGLIGVAVALRVYWRKIVNFFKGNKGDDVVETLDEIDEYGDEIINNEPEE